MWCIPFPWQLGRTGSEAGSRRTTMHAFGCPCRFLFQVHQQEAVYELVCGPTSSPASASASMMHLAICLASSIPTFWSGRSLKHSKTAVAIIEIT